MFRHGRLKKGFASIDISDGISWKFRIAKIASTFIAEALAISETLEIIEKTDLKQNFMIFLDAECVLNGICNASTIMNTTSHSAQMLTDKIEILESRDEKKIQFPGYQDTVELK
jgi:hypothetical protein